MTAQRDCLNHAAGLIGGRPGVVLELGLGNGRTYDHLREILPEREIYVFERRVASYPACTPPSDHLFVGEIGDTLPRAAALLGGTAVLVHNDLGTSDPDYNRTLVDTVGPLLPPLLAQGAVMVCNAAFSMPHWQQK